MIPLQNNNGGCVEYDDTATFLFPTNVSFLYIRAITVKIVCNRLVVSL